MSILWIVCPVYHDVAAFLEVRRDVACCLEGLELVSPHLLRFVVVDDTGHQDPDMARLERLDDVHVVRAPFHLGHQAAIVLGLRTLSAHLAADDWVVTMDADGEDRPLDLPRLLGPLSDLQRGQLSVVLAYRTKRHESWTFKTLYVAFKLVCRILTGVVIRTGNYAAFPGALVKQVIFHPSFDLSYSSTLVGLRVPAIFVPCERGRRGVGESNMNGAALLRHGIGMLLPFADRVAIRVFLAFSTLFLGGVIVTSVAVGIEGTTGSAFPSWAWYALLSIMTVSVTAIGHAALLFLLFTQSRGRVLRDLRSSTVESGPECLVKTMDVIIRER